MIVSVVSSLLTLLRGGGTGAGRRGPPGPGEDRMRARGRPAHRRRGPPRLISAPARPTTPTRTRHSIPDKLTSDRAGDACTSRQPLATRTCRTTNTQQGTAQRTHGHATRASSPVVHRHHASLIITHALVGWCRSASRPNMRVHLTSWTRSPSAARAASYHDHSSRGAHRLRTSCTTGTLSRLLASPLERSRPRVSAAASSCPFITVASEGRSCCVAPQGSRA
jgi:hypothetical protein